MTIRIFAQGTVTRENRQAFTAYVAKLVKAIREKEAGKTLVYDFYISDGDEDGNCSIHEAYVDGDALVQHLQNLGDDLAGITQVFQTNTMRISGAVPRTVIDALAGIGDLKNHPNLLDAI